MAGFTGYRGVARRPRADERAEPIRIARPAAEAFRAIVHELRTPTNAISGFAEMIEAQVLGPAPDAYRARAAAIRGSTRELLDAIEDVDIAARLDQQALVLRPGTVAIAPMLSRAAVDLEPLMRLRGAVVDIDRGPPGLGIAGDESCRGADRQPAAQPHCRGERSRRAADSRRRVPRAIWLCLRSTGRAHSPRCRGNALFSLDSEDQGEGATFTRRGVCTSPGATAGGRIGRRAGHRRGSLDIAPAGGVGSRRGAAFDQLT